MDEISARYLGLRKVDILVLSDDVSSLEDCDLTPGVRM